MLSRNKNSSINSLDSKFTVKYRSSIYQVRWTVWKIVGKSETAYNSGIWSIFSFYFQAAFNCPEWLCHVILQHSGFVSSFQQLLLLRKSHKHVLRHCFQADLSMHPLILIIYYLHSFTHLQLNLLHTLIYHY